MKNFLLAIVMLAGTIASAEATFVPYGQWTSIPYCGGQTMLLCDDVPMAKQQNRCYVHVRNSFGCDRIKLYVGSDYHPTYVTTTHWLRDLLSGDGSYYVDYSKINTIGADYFRVFMHSSATKYNGDYVSFRQIRYQFNH